MNTNKKNKLAPFVKLLGFLALFAAFFAVYKVFIRLEWIGGMWIYLILSCVLFVAYFVLNRGFSSEPTDPESLPDEMTAAEKTEYLEKEEKRKKAAKTVLAFFGAVALTLLFDLTDLYLGDAVRKLFGIE